MNKIDALLKKIWDMQFDINNWVANDEFKEIADKLYVFISSEKQEAYKKGFIDGSLEVKSTQEGYK